MTARDFWSGVWRTASRQGPPWQVDPAELRAKHFEEAAVVLDGIADKQECFDDAEMQDAAVHTRSCANALRVFIAASIQVRRMADAATPTSKEQQR